MQDKGVEPSGVFHAFVLLSGARKERKTTRAT